MDLFSELKFDTLRKLKQFNMLATNRYQKMKDPEISLTKECLICRYQQSKLHSFRINSGPLNFKLPFFS